MNIILKNIKGNKIDYGIYLTTVTIGVAILYIFNSIIFNDVLDKILKNFDKANGVFYAALAVIMIAMGIFIYYSNSFFIKKRKREFGIFALLGVGNKKIVKMIFTENIVVGLIASILGCGIGVILAKFIINAYLHIFNLGLASNIEGINSKALMITNIMFWVFYIYISLNSADIINKYTLVELFNGDKKREEPFKKEIIKGIPAVILILIGYCTYPWAIATLGLSVLVTLTIVIKGTYKLFRTKVIERIEKKKERYGFEDKIQLVAMSNLLYRIRSNARTLSTITILIASTLTTVGICSTLYFSSDGGVNNELAGSIYFVGIFIGIVFTISTLSILLFKFVQEAYDEKHRYKTLKQIGFTKNDIKTVIIEQLKTVYFIPLIIGGIHATVALSITILGLGGQFFTIIGSIYLIYGGVYLIYFFITKKLYVSVIFNEM